MSRNTKSKSNGVIMTELPCRQCMSYLSPDIKPQLIKQHKYKMEILCYLQNLSDPKILRKIICLLKNLAQL